LTDNNTLNGIEYVSRYHNDFQIIGMKSRDLVGRIKDADSPLDEGLLLINIPENYPEGLTELEGERFRLVQRFDRKRRKICYVKIVQEKFADTLCNVSRGGRIYQILSKDNDAT